MARPAADSDDDDSDDEPAPEPKAKAATKLAADSDDSSDDELAPKVKAVAKAEPAADTDDDSDDEPAPKPKAKAAAKQTPHPVRQPLSGLTRSYRSVLITMYIIYLLDSHVVQAGRQRQFERPQPNTRQSCSNC